jgi:hypothetical protein
MPGDLVQHPRAIAGKQVVVEHIQRECGKGSGAYGEIRH